MGADHTDSTGVFDVDAALAKLDGDQMFFRELATVFLDECPHWLDEMTAGLSQQSARTVARAAHNLKGAACHFAAASTVAAAQQLEEIAERGNVANADRAFHALVREANLLMHGLTLLVKRPNGSNDAKEPLARKAGPLRAI